MAHTLYSDGGARGNPGPAGIGAVIMDDKNQIVGQVSEYIGVTTNNIAEYHAIYSGLAKAKELGITDLQCKLDSELVVNQLNQKYRVKNVDLGPWFVKIWNLRQDFKTITFEHIRREQNTLADSLVNQAIDKEQGL